MRRLAIVLSAAALLSCGGGSHATTVTPPGLAPLLAAGPVRLDPSASVASVKPDVDLGALGITTVAAAYDLTTPAGEPFALDVICRSPGNAGYARVSWVHAASGGASPESESDPRERAPVTIEARGRTTRGPWTDAVGDGFARLSVRGQVNVDHVFAAQADVGNGPATVLIRVRIGPPSPINAAAAPGTDHPGVLEEATLYSSDSWGFGLPAIATSGDKTSVVCYEGDRTDPAIWTRYEMRLQYDRVSGEVTGGGSDETSPDSGNWRDHEVAALYNVLARAHGGSDAVALAISYDRGATFAQTETFPSPGTAWRPRLVQVAIALDYSLALLYWRSNVDGTTDLVLVEGAPSAYDPQNPGSPSAYRFDPAVVLHHVGGDVTPALMGATWSVGGDLVIGFAYTSFTSRPDFTWQNRTDTHVLVRPWGGAVRDTLVEEDVVVGKDPSVAVVGEGDTLRVFLAYEARDGVRVAVSDDAGRTFSTPVSLGDPSANAPTIFAREKDAATVVDVLYLAQAPEGLELHVAHWDDGVTGAIETWRLTRAKRDDAGLLPPDRPLPGAPTGALPPAYGYRQTQIAWLGYDATEDDDGHLVVVYDEETWEDLVMVYDVGMPPMPPMMGAGGMPSAADPRFVPVDPPPLAPGMTMQMPPPDGAQMHQLRWIRLE